LIQPNYFSSNVDLDKHINGIEIIRKISKTSPLSEFIIKEHLPGSALTKKQDLIDFIKDTSTTVYHPTGTCRIGDDNKGVVDDKLRVIGIKNLRVCDASIFPESITGNPVASCYLAGMVLVNDIIS
jgi:choline dehydrogenase